MSNKKDKYPLVNKTFGGYTLTAGIQKTKNSVVYESTHPINCNKLAIKFIRKKSMSEEQCMNEIEINRAIDCDYILPIDEIINEVPEKFYCAIVMKKATGCDLLDMVSDINGPLDEPIAAQVAYVGLMALKYLHSVGICHRDVKIENFFLMDQNRKELDIVLADFGHACHFNPGEKMNFFSIGTRIYSAPEILKREEYDESIDIWSLGCVIYSILVAKVPFNPPKNELDPYSVRICEDAIIRGDCDYTRGHWLHVSNEAKDFVQSMLQVEPENRASIDELLDHPWIHEYNVEYNRQETRRNNARLFSQLPIEQQRRTPNYYE